MPIKGFDTLAHTGCDTAQCSLNISAIRRTRTTNHGSRAGCLDYFNEFHFEKVTRTPISTPWYRRDRHGKPARY